MWASRQSNRYCAALIEAARTALDARAAEGHRDPGGNPIREWWAARHGNVHRNHVLYAVGARVVLADYAARAAAVTHRDDALGNVLRLEAHHIACRVDDRTDRLLYRPCGGETRTINYVARRSSAPACRPSSTTRFRRDTTARSCSRG
jgi:hypothetical protein